MAQIEMTIDSLRCNLLSNERALILKEKGAERYLPIYIGPRQANIVEKLLIGVGRVDPAEFDLSSAGIDIIFCKVESVIINRFEDNIFCARLLLSQHDKPYDVNCPPAMALALAVRAGAPIFAVEAVLDKAGIATEA